MAIRIIRVSGDEILTKVAKKVDEIDEKVKELVKDMIETLHHYDGIGLAATQVGILKRIAVIDLYEEGKEPFVLINPEIISSEGEQTVDEGCLSFPNQFAKVVRPKKVVIRAQDIDGNYCRLEAEELLAQAIAHEVDHLNGELFVNKVIPGTLETITEKPKEDAKKLLKRKEE
ncbi:MAG: peptide deformylase [Lachnospiraceae bacterium]|jgi:peptide deformylase|nr:peptide deformylase [Lachnospiraceae bacterium]